MMQGLPCLLACSHRNRKLLGARGYRKLLDQLGEVLQWHQSWDRGPHHQARSCIPPHP